MFDALRQAMGSDGFMPHGMCYLWEPELLWTHVVADTLTWLSYWAIPPALLYLVIQARRQSPGTDERGLPYEWIFWAFGIFIVACGGTHLMAVWTVWNPDYWASGGVKVVTAMASVTTAVALPPLVPRVLDVLREARLSEGRRRQLEKQNRELAVMNDRLKEAEAARTRFFANVSHELRTPLTLVLGPAEELLSDRGLSGEQRRHVRSIRTNALGLLDQVDDLLEVARIEGGEIPMRPTELDLGRWVRQSAETFRGAARRKGIRYEVRTPERLDARLDPGGVERILRNLLSNAFKFVPADGVVRCTLEAADGGTELHLVVEDSGPGVAPEDREIIFQRFRQGLRPAPAEAQGSGLGLAIVRELSDTMGGEVEVGESEFGGARFTVTLPRRMSEPTTPTSPRDPTGTRDPDGPLETVGPPDADGTVLVVEDDPELNRFVTDILRERYRVYRARDGVEGLRTALRVQPDLILTDLMMPEMDGEELVREVGRQEALAGTPVIVLTARAGRELPARLLEAGAADYLVKPMEAGELRARVRNAMELHRTRRILLAGGDSDEPLQKLAAELVRGREELARNVRQKQIAVQELHHRVKGNLQTISSLLNIQIRSLVDEEARRALGQARSRITAMALVHERLYEEDDPSHLSLRAFLRSLASMTGRAHLSDVGRIPVSVDAPEVSLPSDRAVTMGLIVYELLSNALQHAFPGDRSGSVAIEVSMESEPDPHLRLTVADTGVGLADESRDDPGFGLELVEALTRQLHGSFTVGAMPGHGGTIAELRLPLGSP